MSAPLTPHFVQLNGNADKQNSRSLNSPSPYLTPHTLASSSPGSFPEVCQVTSTSAVTSLEMPDLSLGTATLVEDKARQCWICFGDDNDTNDLIWVKACPCSLIAHEVCLLSWINEIQKGSAHKKVRCPQCNSIYKLSDPHSYFIDIFSRVDGLVQATVPYITLMGLTSSIIVSSTTYGAYAVLTVCGNDLGEEILGSPQPWGWRAWTGLPLVPWMLIASRFRAFDAFLPVVPLLVLGNDNIKFTWPPNPSLLIASLPWLRMFYNAAKEHLTIKVLGENITNRFAQNFDQNNEIERRNGDINDDDFQEGNAHVHHDGRAQIIIGNHDITRKVVGALLFPAISSMSGNILQFFLPAALRSKLLPYTLLRSLAGGCLFILLKDLTGLLYKYHLVRRIKNRHIYPARNNHS